MAYKGASAQEKHKFDPEQDDYFEIENIDILGGDAEAVEKSSRKPPVDSFRQVEISQLPNQNVKRKANRLNKRLVSQDEKTGSKFIDPKFINGYTLWDLVPPPYDPDALSLIFEENATHNAAVMAKAVNTVGLGYSWEHSRKTKRKIEKAGDDEEKIKRITDLVGDEMERLDDGFEDFNQEETFIESWTRAVIDLYALGNGYVEIGRNNDGSIGYLGHVPAKDIRIRRIRDGFVQQVWQARAPQAVFFRNYGDQSTPDPISNDPKPNELVHLKMYSPRDHFYGVPSIVSALAAVVGDKFAKEYNIDYFENKAIPRYAIIIKGAKLSEKAKKEVIQYFRNEVKGKNHGTLVVPLPATMGQQVDIKFEKLENGVQDASFEKYRKQNRDEVISAHRVPPTKVGVFDNANLATSRDADKTFKEQVVGPEQERIEKRINYLVKEFTDVVKLRFNKVDIIDADMKSRIHDRYLRAEVLVPNEVRDEINRPSLEGGNKVLPFPTNVQQAKNEMDVQQKNKDRQAMKDRPIVAPQPGMPGKPGVPGQAGAPVANTNNPAKAGPKTPADQTGTRRERGQAQDEQKVRERKQ